MKAKTPSQSKAIAKVVENTQRDINIALMNELAMMFDKLKLNTHEVLNAASTKWNFLKFKPGLVGGHCIGVDPYYLLHKSEEIGYQATLLKSSRKINNSVARFVAAKARRKKIIKKQPTFVLCRIFSKSKKS